MQTREKGITASSRPEVLFPFCSSGVANAPAVPPHQANSGWGTPGFGVLRRRQVSKEIFTRTQVTSRAAESRATIRSSESLDERTCLVSRSRLQPLFSLPSSFCWQPFPRLQCTPTNTRPVRRLQQVPRALRSSGRRLLLWCNKIRGNPLRTTPASQLQTLTPARQ